MANFKVTLTATNPLNTPAGTVPAGYVFGIDGMPDSAVVAAAPFEAVFNDVPPGAHTTSVKLVDDKGNVLGAPFTEAFTVAAPDVVVQVPSALSVTPV